MRNPSKGSRVAWGSSPHKPSRPRAGAETERRARTGQAPRTYRATFAAATSTPLKKEKLPFLQCFSLSREVHRTISVLGNKLFGNRYYSLLCSFRNLDHSSSICGNGRRSALSSGQLKVTRKGCNSHVLRSENAPVHTSLFTRLNIHRNTCSLSVNGAKLQICAPPLRRGSR